ncbi:MAG: YigZ family protein [Bacteroidales bacterium]
MPSILSMNFTYKTIEKPSEGIYKEKGSKFIAYCFPVTHISTIKYHIEAIKKEHWGAKHVCWAYRLGTRGENIKYHDAGEPANTAGKPIAGQLISKELTNILAIVVRYFGGTLLGTGGLIQAYKTATDDALCNASVIEKEIELLYNITCKYEHINLLMNILRETKARILQNSGDYLNTMLISVNLKNNALLKEKIEALQYLEVNIEPKTIDNE